MKFMFAILIALFLLLQYELWFSRGGLLTIYRLQHHIVSQQSENKQLSDRNAALLSDIKDLKKGDESVEEHARNDLGMMKENEVFYQVTDAPDKREEK